MYFIGVDLGTSSVKLLLLSEQGIEKTVTREYPVSYPKEGWSEQDPADWLRETLSALEELTADCDRSQVRALSFGGQMHGLVLLDSADQVIRPAILWNDGRTARETDWLNECFGKEQLLDCTGNIAFAGFTAPKVLWVRENEPESFRRISKVMLPKDYLAYMLTGVHCTDVSDASGTLFFDVKNRCWSAKMLELLGLREEQLPRVYESEQCVGFLKPELADRLGFSHEVRVAAGAGDNAAAAIGNGIVHDGDCNISIGTSGTLFVASDRFGVDRQNAIHSFCHANGKYHYMACMLSAAACSKWWLEGILQSDDYRGHEDAVKVLGENRVFFLPYLMGERSPLNDPDIRAAFYGMSLSTTRYDLNQAVLEGVAFAMRDNLETIRALGVDVKRSKVCGGGAKSRLWLEIIANVLNITLEVPENQEGASMGGALLAAKTVCSPAEYASLLKQVTRIKATIAPTPALVSKYEERYAQFAKLYPALKGLIRA